MKLTTLKGSENYGAQVINLPAKVPVTGLDNLVQVTHQGNNCLVQKTSHPKSLYLFFPAGAVLSQQFLSNNNLYRNCDANLDTTKTGFFEPSGRVKALKFKGIISTGFIIPVSALNYLIDTKLLQPGDTFTDINGISICKKYIVRERGFKNGGGKHPKFDIEQLVDRKFAPEHRDTAQLLSNCQQLHWHSLVTITHKLHGTSIRVFRTKTKRRLNLMEKLLRRMRLAISEETFSYLVGSRRVLKSRDFSALGKQKDFKEDLWTKVAKEHLEGRLNKGEAVYGEIVGTAYDGGAIQQGYTYGLTGPELFIYRITQINDEGIEIDLCWQQLKERAAQLGVKTVPEFYCGPLGTLLASKDPALKDRVTEHMDLEKSLEQVFYQHLLDRPSILDPKVTEEGFVLRLETYPRATAYKIKSRKFQLHETRLMDQEVADLEEEN